MTVADKTGAQLIHTQATVLPRRIPEVTAAGCYQAFKVLQGDGGCARHLVQDHQLFQHLQPHSKIP
jgi:hypothetical protein